MDEEASGIPQAEIRVRGGCFPRRSLYAGVPRGGRVDGAGPSATPGTRHESRRSAAISARVFVGNLSFQTTKDDLTQLLSGAGTIRDAHLPKDRETGKLRGFAFVEFATPEEAAEAIRLFNGRELGGRPLRVNLAEDRPRGGDRPRDGDRPRQLGPPRDSDRPRQFSPPRDADRPRFDDRPRSGPRPRPSHSFDLPEGPVFFAVEGRETKHKGSRRGLRARKRS